MTAYIYDNQNRTLTERKGLNEIGVVFSITGGDSGAFNVGLRGGFTPVDTEADGTDIAYAYDRDSNLVERTDEAGNAFASSFDALNRKTGTTIALASGFVGTTALSWQYDGLSRQTVAFDDNDGGSSDDVTVRQAYDSLSRLVEERQQVGDGATERVVSYEYDVSASGAVWQASALVYPDGRQVDSVYDRLDRLVSRTDNGMASAIGTYQYIGPDRVAVLTYQNGTRLTHVLQVMGQTTDSGFDDLRRVVQHPWERTVDGTGMTATLGNGVLVVGFGHQDAMNNPAYDRANNKRIEEKLHDSGAASTLGNSEVYSYQSDYQLRTFQRGTLDATKTTIATPASSGLQAQSWTLDGLGNWTANTHTTGGVALTEDRTATDYNEIGTVSNTPYGEGVTGTHALDANGNLTDDGVRAYEYDPLNRLRRVYRHEGEDLVPIAAYTYDAGNRRFRKEVSNGGLDETALNGVTEFFYDGWRSIEERDGSGEVQRQYVHGSYLDEVWTLDEADGGVIIIGALNDGLGSDRYFFHTNTQYSVHGLTNEEGALVEAYQYDAYGLMTVIRDGTSDGDVVVTFDATDIRTTAGASLVLNPFAYTGQRFDQETHLFFYKNRYYNADLGRFLQRDPIASDSNLYRYVNSGPANATDPSGLQPPWVYFKERKWDGWMKEASCYCWDTVKDGSKVGWKYKYQWAVRPANNDVQITLTIGLTPDGPATKAQLERLAPQWEQALETRYSQWKIRNSRTPHGVIDVPITFDFDFKIDPGSFNLVRFVALGMLGNGMMQTVNVKEGNGRSDMLTWYLGDADYTTAPFQGVVHEVGHMLGLKDEYLDPEFYPEKKAGDLPGDAARSIMGNMRAGNILQRHVKQILEQTQLIDHLFHPSGGDWGPWEIVPR